jgi:seryl-tRNA(Sec) selenium transferase
MCVFHELELRPIINASGEVTRLGGAPMPAAVLEAFVAAAGDWIPLDELQAAARHCRSRRGRRRCIGRATRVAVVAASALGPCQTTGERGDRLFLG